MYPGSHGLATGSSRRQQHFTLHDYPRTSHSRMRHHDQHTILNLLYYKCLLTSISAFSRQPQVHLRLLLSRAWGSRRRHSPWYGKPEHPIPPSGSSLCPVRPWRNSSRDAAYHTASTRQAPFSPHSGSPNPNPRLLSPDSPD
jgi:hypothetical protein